MFTDLAGLIAIFDVVPLGVFQMEERQAIDRDGVRAS